MQVQTSGTGLGLRGVKVTLHMYFDGRLELLWRERRLAYTEQDKPLRQAPVADGKTVNERVDKTVARRSAGHKPALNYP